MKFIKFLAFLLLIHSWSAQAEVGLSVASGIPYLGQAGIHYKASDKLSFYVGYNSLSLDSGLSSVTLTMPELSVLYHPFGGSFFLAIGAGQEELEAKATDLTTSLEAKATVSAMTTVAKLGWMWGSSDGGLWFGMDIAYVAPSGGEVEITAPGLSTTDQAYKDTVDAAEDFGDTAYINFTFARIGYYF